MNYEQLIKQEEQEQQEEAVIEQPNTEIDDSGPAVGVIESTNENVEAPVEQIENIEVQKTEAKPIVTDFNSFKQVRHESKKDPSSIVKPKEEIKEEEKVEEKLEDKQGRIQPNVKLPEKRDYSGLEKDEIELFQRMRNDAFAKLKPVFLEHKKLKQEIVDSQKKLNEELTKSKTNGLPDSYYEHPEAFLLSQEYKDLSGITREAESIKNHWRLQEISIKRNGKFQDLDRNKNGQLVLGELKDATPEDELQVSNYADAAREQYLKQSNKLENLTSGFKGKHDADIKVLKGYEEQYFKGFDDENHPTKELQKAIIDNMPPSFRGSPVTKLLGKVGAANGLLVAENKTLKAEIAKLKGIKQDAEAAPPTKEKLVAGKESKQKGSIIDSFSAFQRIKNGEL